MMEERMIKINEVAMVLDVNQFTIERWYRFKRENPDNEYAQLLPEPIRVKGVKNRWVRHWKESDLEALKQFKDMIVPGTKGFMKSQFIYQPKRRKDYGQKKTD